MHEATAKRGGESRFLPNSVALIAQTVVATLVALIQVKILATHLDKDAFGLFASLRGFSLLLAMVAANGLPHLLLRYIPSHEALARRRRAIRLSAMSVLAALVLLGIVGVLAGVFRTRLLSFHGAGELGGATLFWFGAMTFGVALKMVVYGGFNGLRRITTQVILEMLTQIAALAWMIAYRDELTLLLLFKIFGVVHLVTLGAALPVFFTLLLRSVSAPQLSRGAENPESFSTEYGPYLAWAAALSFVGVAFTDVDRYLLAHVLSLEVLALFHLGARVSRLAHRFLGVFNLALQPEITRLSAVGRHSDVTRATSVFIKLNLLFAAVSALAIVLFAREIILAIASTEYVGAIPLLLILAACLPVSTLTAPLTTAMKALNQVSGALVTDITWAVSYVGLMFVLGPSLGLVGVGVANLIACLAQLLCAVKITRLPVDLAFIGRLSARIAGAAAASFSPVVAWTLFERSASLPLALPVKALLFAGGVAVLPALVRATGVFSPEEKEHLRGILDRPGLEFVHGWL